ncbi:MAG: M1 family metallopeptidase, partial [Paraclostridium sp.]
MIVVFNKRVRRYLSLVLMIMVIIGGGIYFTRDKTIQASKEKIENINDYTMDVIFDDENKRFMCNQTIKYVNNTSENLGSIYFHIYPNAFSKEEFAPFEKSEMKLAYPNGFNEGYIDIKNIISKDKNLNYNIIGEKEDILEVKLQNSLKPNQEIEIDMKYNVKLPNSSGRFGYGDSTINVTNWFPIACVYDERGWNTKSYEEIGDPFYSEISNFNVTILSPKNYKLATTGKVVDSKNDDKKSMHIIEADNVRDFAFILSDEFNVDKDVTKNIDISTYNLNKEFSEFSTEVAKDSIEIFSDMFGKYPYDTYSVIASDFFIGGMEYPTLSMIDKSLYTEQNKFLLEYVIAHETAHQWWYSAIGNDEISEPWLDEALTEYS